MAQLQSTSITGSLIVTGGITGSFSGSIVSPGSTTQVLYNNGGVVSADSGLVYSSSFVGIGTATPNYKLHVNGTAYINETLYVNQATTVEDTFTVKTATGAYNVAVIDYSGVAGGRIKIYTDGVLRSQIGSYYGDDTFFNAGYGGNVGIGNSSPASLLHVGPTTNYTITGRTSTVYTGSDSETIFTIGRSGTDYPQLLDFGVNQSGLYSTISARQFTTTENRLVLQPNGGNVGINTKTPSQKLDVAGQAAIGSGAQAIVGTDGTYAGYATIGFGGTTNGYNRVFGNSGTGDGLYIAAATSNAIVFWTNGANERMIITAAGNVGIGTNSPTEVLDLRGVFRVSKSGINDSGIIAFGNYLNGAGYYDNGIFRSTLNAISTSGNILHMGSYEALVFTTSPNPLGSQTIRMYISGANGNVGINTTTPIASLDNQGAAGTYRQNGVTTMVTNTLGASGEQAKRFEIARISIDYNDWNSVGPVEIEIYEKYWSQGLRKKYSVYYGYVSTSGINLNEMTGVGQNNFQATIGAEVVISGDNRYIPIYVDVKYYAQVTVILKTNRELTTSNPPGIGGIWVNNAPTGTNISDFTADSVVYVGNLISGNSTFSTGNVGIGTISPSKKLHIKGGDDDVLFLDNGGQQYTTQYFANNGTTKAFLAWDNTNSVYSIGTAVSSAFYFSTNNTERMRITSGGNVGIGTSSPATKLDLTGTLGFTVGSTSAIIRRTTVNGSNGIVIQGNANDTISDTNAGASIYVGGGTLTDTYEGNIDFTAYGAIVDANRNQIRFFNRSGVNTVTERMRINHLGNVGIGTASPGYKLDVSGVTSTQGLYIPGLYTFGQSQSGIEMQLTSTSYNAIRFYQGTDYTGVIHSFGRSWGGGVSVGMVNIEGYNGVTIGAWNIPTATFLSSGNVGIGTTAPGTPLGGAMGLVIDGNANGDVQIRIQANSTGRTSTDGGLLSISGTAMYLWNYENDALYFGTNNTARITITSGGNVGIGTTTPSQKLEVSGGDALIRTAYIGNISAYGTNYASFSHTSRAGAGDYSFLSGNAGETYINAKSGSPIYFRVNNTDKVIITDAGYVGIGTTTPSVPLEVVGAISGSSINFGQNDLNFYEENTWTPAIETVNNDIGTVNYSGEPIASYTRIGNVVHTWFTVDISSIGGIGTGTGKITGLPYTAASNGAPFTAVILDGSVILSGAAGRQLKGYIDQGSDYITLYLYDSGTSGYGPIANTLWDATGGIISGYVSYQV
jgi:hypothetical protein